MFTLKDFVLEVGDANELTADILVDLVLACDEILMLPEDDWPNYSWWRSDMTHRTVSNARAVYARTLWDKSFP